MAKICHLILKCCEYLAEVECKCSRTLKFNFKLVFKIVPLKEHYGHNYLAESLVIAMAVIISRFFYNVIISRYDSLAKRTESVN